MKLICHPERSEGPHIGSWITQTALGDRPDYVRSLAVCATRMTRQREHEHGNV